jgi:hypothetical protein
MQMTFPKSHHAVVNCPFCDAAVDSRALADHARLKHGSGRKEDPEPALSTDLVTGIRRQISNSRKKRVPGNRSIPRGTEDFESMLYDLDRTGRPDLRAHLVKGETGDPESGRIWCPYCNAGVRPARMQKHLEKVHPHIAEMGAKGKSAAMKKEPSWSMHCPICQAAINKTGFQEHLVDVHGMEIRLEKSGPRLVLPPLERAEDWILSGMFLCPLCRAKLYREDMGQHFEGAHPEIKLLRRRSNLNKL